MNNGYFKYYKSSVLITLITFFGVVLFFAKDYWGWSFSIVSFISALLFIIDKWLWNKKMFSWMFWVENFSGRYEGELEYEYRDENCKIQKGRLKHVKIIHQSGSKISIFSFTIKNNGIQSSLSENKGIYVEQMNGGKHYQFIYAYLNNGNFEVGPHFGTEIIKFIRKGQDKFLSGRYFTERLPFSTKGNYIELKWVSNNEEHEF